MIDVSLKSNKVIAGTLLIAISLLISYFYGFTVFEAQGTCYTEKGKCHGLPINGCIGNMELEKEFVSEKQCNALDEIKASCNSVRQRLCRSPNITGNEWQDAIVKDFSCRKWSEVYSVDLKNCPA